jgi:hypothetical protein
LCICTGVKYPTFPGREKGSFETPDEIVVQSNGKKESDVSISDDTKTSSDASIDSNNAKNSKSVSLDLQRPNSPIGKNTISSTSSSPPSQPSAEPRMTLPKLRQPVYNPTASQHVIFAQISSNFLEFPHFEHHCEQTLSSENVLYITMVDWWMEKVFKVWKKQREEEGATQEELNEKLGEEEATALAAKYSQQNLPPPPITGLSSASSSPTFSLSQIPPISSPSLDDESISMAEVQSEMEVDVSVTGNGTSDEKARKKTGILRKLSRGKRESKSRIKAPEDPALKLEDASTMESEIQEESEGGIPEEKKSKKEKKVKERQIALRMKETPVPTKKLDLTVPDKGTTITIVFIDVVVSNEFLYWSLLQIQEKFLTSASPYQVTFCMCSYSCFSPSTSPLSPSSFPP